MSIIEAGLKAANIIIGADTHKSTHVAEGQLNLFLVGRQSPRLKPNQVSAI